MSLHSKSIYYVYIIIALIGGAICMIKEYASLPLFILPLSYAVVTMLCRKVKEKMTSLPLFIINSVCLIRFVLYPIILTLEQSYGTYYIGISTEAIYLMAYEVFAVQIFINFYCKRLDNNVSCRSGCLSNSTLGPLNKCLLILVIPIGILFPSLLSFFQFLGIQGGYTAPGVVAVFFEMGVTVAYVYLLSVFSKRNNFVSLLLSVSVALGYIFLTMVSGENVRRWLFLWTGIPTVYVLLNSYPNYKNFIKTLAVIGIPLGIFFGSFAKFAISNVSILEFTNNFMGSEMLSEYFGGLNSLSYSMAYLSEDAAASSFTSLFTDLFGNMPVVSNLFDTSIYSTQAIYQSLIDRTDLICPLLGQSYTHFGAIGAPLFSIMMVCLAIECDALAKRATNVYEIYALITLCVVFSLFMCLNTMIILTHTWTLLIFLIIQHFNKNFTYYSLSNLS